MLFDTKKGNLCFSSAFPNGFYSLLQNKSSVGGTEAWAETALQGVQLKSEDDLIKQFGDIREDGYSPVIRWFDLCQGS